MLQEKLQSDAINALKAKDVFSVGVLRLALASVNSKEKEKRYAIAKDDPNIQEENLKTKSALTDQEVLDVIISEIKKRRDAVALYEKGGRPELSTQEKKEIEVLQKYLPEQLSESELKELVVQAIASVQAKTVKDIGKIMADLMVKVRGRADGSRIAAMIKELLTS